MSLINDALKKAQSQNAAASRVGLPYPATASLESPPPRRRSRLLFGCLLSGIVLPTLMLILSAVLLTTFVEDNPSLMDWAQERIALLRGDTGAASSSAADALPGPARVEPPPPAIEPPSAATAPPDGNDLGDRVELVDRVEQGEEPDRSGPQALAAEDSEADPPAVAAAATDEGAPAIEIEPVAPVAPAPVTAPPARPATSDPAIAARVRALEIRGVMSGQSRILIYDPVTGRTRAFEIGQVIEGIHPLTVIDIQPNRLTLEDDAGFIHSKAF